MENDPNDGNYESSFSFHTKITKKRRRLSRLSLRKHFRKSLKYDRVESTIPNKTLSIIEKSSTDCSTKSVDSIEIISINSSSSDCEDIITPSPNKNNSKIKCLSNRKKTYDIIKQNSNKTPSLNVKPIEEKGKGSDYKVEYVMDPKAFLEFSLLDYENFQKPRIIPNNVMNSTMVKPNENIPSCKESDPGENSNVDIESAEYCENVLDDIYGDSWRPFREKVLPKSERKPCNKQINNEKKCPASERRAKKSDVKTNEYVENGNHKPNNLLKMLHLKKTKEAMQSPFMRDLKVLCDEENSKINNIPITIRAKLNFDENDKLKPGNDEKFERKDILFDDFSALADEKLSLKERLEKKILKEKNIIECKEPPKKSIGHTAEENYFDINTNEVIQGDKPKKFSVGEIVNKNHQETPPSSDDSFRNVVGINKVKKKVQKKYLKKYLDSSSSGDSSDEVEKINKGVPKTLNKKSKIGDNPSSDRNVEKKLAKETECFTLSSEDSNRADDYVKRTVNKKGLKTKINQKYLSEDSKESKIRENPSSDRNVGKKHTKETKYFSLSSEDSNGADDYVKKTVNKKGSKIKTSHKYLSDDSEVSPVEVKYKSNSKEQVNSTKTYSFLASLSSNVPDHKCDPTAKVFKANFKNNKEELTRKLFVLFNKNIFNDLLPKDTALEWNARMLCTAGYCYSKRITHSDGKIDLMARIVLSSKVLTTPDRLRDTLIHEMCHAATWIIDNMRDGHGRYWKAWAKKATEVYPELPPIKTCHNYEIQSKYIYRCTGCGYSIRRHRKSLDIERKRCGYCMGKFEIFINKVNKKGENELKPIDTPKKQPKGFALFVKENYYKYKNTNSAEAMKLLSKEFNKMKVQ